LTKAVKGPVQCLPIWPADQVAEAMADFLAAIDFPEAIADRPQDAPAR
jgi:hypothetical protein